MNCLLFNKERSLHHYINQSFFSKMPTSEYKPLFVSFVFGYTFLEDINNFYGVADTADLDF